MRLALTATAAIAAALYIGILTTTAMTKVIHDLHNLPLGY